MIHAIVIALVVAAIVAITSNIIVESNRKKPAPNQAQTTTAQQAATAQQPTTTDGKWWIVTNWKKAASAVLGVCLVLLALWGVWSIWSWIKTPSDESSVISRTATNNNLSHGVPMEVALRVICECESGCRQFKDDGSLLWNKEGSTAVGKYQILASMHEERAKKMGLNIRTEEGNEGYARVLYAESGTKHWEVDPRSGKCWEPKLRAYAWGGAGGEAVSIVVVAPTDKWSDEIPLPRNGDKGGKTTIDEMGKKVTILWNNEIEDNVPRPEGVAPKFPARVDSFRVKSREAQPVRVNVKFF